METTLRPSVAIQFHRWGAAAFVLGNLLFILNKLNEMSRLFLSRPMPDLISGQSPPLVLIGQAALIIGYVTYARLYLPRVGRYGKYSLRLFSLGGILLAIGHVSFMTALDQVLPSSFLPLVGDFFILVLIGVFLLVIGLIWFGILNLRRPVLAHAQWLPLLTGLIGFIGFFLVNEVRPSRLYFSSFGRSLVWD
jgi:hypothetical protein